MEPTSPGRIRFIGGVNLLLGVSAPLRILSSALLGTRANIPQGGSSEFLWMVVVESILGGLAGHCGWVLLKRLPRAIRETKGTSAAMLGYFACGVATIFQRGPWNPSLSIAQTLAGMTPDAAVRLLMILVLDGVQCLWWLYCLWSIGLRQPTSLPEEEPRNLSSLALLWIALFGGLVLRAFQIGSDSSIWPLR
jgi:hypothetical protein